MAFLKSSHIYGSQVAKYARGDVKLNKKPNWCAGTSAKGILCTVCRLKSKYSYGLKGKAIAFLWHAEILVASRQI